MTCSRSVASSSGRVGGGAGGQQGQRERGNWGRGRSSASRRGRGNVGSSSCSSTSCFSTALQRNAGNSQNFTVARSSCVSVANRSRLDQCNCGFTSGLAPYCGCKGKVSMAGRRLGSSSSTVCHAAATVTPKDEIEYKPPPSIGDALANVDYAIVEVGGQQLIVQEGRHYVANHLKVAPGTKIELNRVYGVKRGAKSDSDQGSFLMGTPVVANATVEALVLQTVRAPKVTVFKFKRKKHYKRTQGHRQLMSRFVITKITMPEGEE